MQLSPYDNKREKTFLKSETLETPLGSMLSLADEYHLYWLDFTDRQGFEKRVARLSQQLRATISPGETRISRQIKLELSHYFSGERSYFETPIAWIGSDFQQQVWQQLRSIPVGETRSYLDIAKALKRPTACRAVARANSSNPLAIIVPCHRVIQSNGNLGGYAGGIHRKTWLLQHETKR